MKSNSIIFVVLLGLALLQTTHCTFDCNFEDYLISYRKSYPNATEKAQRKLAFQKECAEVNKNNLDPKRTCNYSINKFSDYIDREAEMNLRKLDRSTLPPSKNLNADSQKVSAPSIPLTLDYKAQGHISSIKDQGSCGCCWSFASIGMYEAYLSWKGLGSYGLSEQASLECTSYYAPNKRESDCTGGYFPDPLNFLAKVGALLRSNYPYISGSFGSIMGYPHTNGICSDPNRIMAGSGSQAIYSQGLSVTQIKTLLVTEGPMMVGVYADYGFSRYSGGVYSSCPANAYSQINHAVLLYGWDANGWLIKNQWGTSWGDNGYMTLSFDRDCGMSSLLGNIIFTTTNNPPTVKVDSSLLFTYNFEKYLTVITLLAGLLLLI